MYLLSWKREETHNKKFLKSKAEVYATPLGLILNIKKYLSISISNFPHLVSPKPSAARKKSEKRHAVNNGLALWRKKWLIKHLKATRIATAKCFKHKL